MSVPTYTYDYQPAGDRWNYQVMDPLSSVMCSGQMRGTEKALIAMLNKIVKRLQSEFTSNSGGWNRRHIRINPHIDHGKPIE